MFKVLFDLDGVLVDACELHYKALNEALYSVSRFKISKREHNAKYNGLPTHKKLGILVGEGKLTEVEAESVYTEKQRRTVDVIKEKIEPRPEKIEMMEALREKGIRIACVTNCSKDTAVMMLKRSEIFDYLDTLIANEDVNEPKPDPEGYLMAMKRLEVTPGETLIIEDSRKGYTAAVRSGAKYIIKVDMDGVDDVDWPLIEKVMICKL